MSERCIVRVKFTPAGAGAEVRRAVGGFLRYVQHRDLHPDATPQRSAPKVTGLLKYVAYRDKASARAELFGPTGALGTQERKAFADFVALRYRASGARGRARMSAGLATDSFRAGIEYESLPLAPLAAGPVTNLEGARSPR